jgi:HAD superfamily hydrolase (TIGR01459 family)
VTRLLSGLSEIAAGYGVILCDVWGVLHNGSRAYEGAAAALERFRAGGGKVVLLTNSPNPGRFVAAQLGRLGVTRGAYDGIVSSGDVTVSLLAARAEEGVFHIGPPGETFLFDEVLAIAGKAPQKVPLKQAQFVLCTGLADPWRETLADYDALLAAMRARNLELLCANPDILVEDGGMVFYCAGALAERYAAKGGKAVMAGKPFTPIFARALALAGAARAEGEGKRESVLVIGDTVETDIKGAHLLGIDSLLVTSGIHRNDLHGNGRCAALDAAALRQFLEAAGIFPMAAIPELIW